jgi:DNA-binding transcriptional LysR family regulator
MNLHRLDLVSLSLFVNVLHSGSISKGAAIAHLAIGAASKRMSDLEAAVGAELFERHSRGVTPTAAGQALARHAQRILSDVNVLASELADHASGIVGVVRLWANTSAITQFLPNDIAAFTASNPGVRIELEELNSNEVVLAVLEGRADVGIFADRTPALGLHLMEYREDRLVLVVPAAHPLARRRALYLEEALDCDFVGLSRGTSLARRLQSETEALGQRLKVRIHVRSFDAMCQMVAAGLGVAVLPADAVQALLRALNLRQVALKDGWARRRLLLCVRDPDELPRHAKALMGHLRGPQPG